MCMNVILVKVKCDFNRILLGNVGTLQLSVSIRVGPLFQDVYKTEKKRTKLILLTQKRDLKRGCSRIEPITAIGRSY